MAATRGAKRKAATSLSDGPTTKRSRNTDCTSQRSDTASEIYPDDAAASADEVDTVDTEVSSSSSEGEDDPYTRATRKVYKSIHRKEGRLLFKAVPSKIIIGLERGAFCNALMTIYAHKDLRNEILQIQYCQDEILGQFERFKDRKGLNNEQARMRAQMNAMQDSLEEVKRKQEADSDVLREMQRVQKDDSEFMREKMSAIERLLEQKLA
ncbi:hypothetical protein Tdes44962_MAKER06229 [Teratosphaeria destructans]|uniref:Uncharacterized protein n=1 Tax=Teratosphaeria destructans TaxID=418781 RepID=A0A9W7VXV4_9PEZI|nr:hypothetical protein Tdes44962_MAKER06229 [Teratosphaeria destructans]